MFSRPSRQEGLEAILNLLIPVLFVVAPQERAADSEQAVEVLAREPSELPADRQLVVDSVVLSVLAQVVVLRPASVPLRADAELEALDASGPMELLDEADLIDVDGDNVDDEELDESDLIDA